jgi:hypothetical protein
VRPASQCDLLFFSINKSEALFSPSTRDRDLARREAATLITADRRLQQLAERALP